MQLLLTQSVAWTMHAQQMLEDGWSSDIVASCLQCLSKVQEMLAGLLVPVLRESMEVATLTCIHLRWVAFPSNTTTE